MSETPVHQGQIWEVVQPFYVNLNHQPKDVGDRKAKVLLEPGEKIEIRYPYAWHFRTEDNRYFQADELDILSHCILFGEIWENVKFANRCNLADILRLGLYERIKPLANPPFKDEDSPA